jgi:hypothetical protein
MDASLQSAGSRRFYSPRQMYVASLLGSPIAAAWFFSRNYAAMADRPKEIRVIWAGLLATILLFALSPFLPKQLPNLVLPIAYSFAIYQYAKVCFKAPLEKYYEMGCRPGSWWVVIGISVLAILIVIGVTLGVFRVFPQLLPSD